jgi:hypothetical protein|tara:strand:- start:1202 stop:1627 length:426 start_codon:yes stop_codon:yes gene_type:complete
MRILSRIDFPMLGVQLALVFEELAYGMAELTWHRKAIGAFDTNFRQQSSNDGQVRLWASLSELRADIDKGPTLRDELLLEVEITVNGIVDDMREEIGLTNDVVDLGPATTVTTADEIEAILDFDFAITLDENGNTDSIIVS